VPGGTDTFGSIVHRMQIKLGSKFLSCLRAKAQLHTHITKCKVKALRRQTASNISRVGQNHIYTVYIRYIRQGNH